MIEHLNPHRDDLGAVRVVEPNGGVFSRVVPPRTAIDPASRSKRLAWMALAALALLASTGCQKYYLSLVALTPNFGKDVYGSPERDEAARLSMGADRFMRVAVDPADATMGKFIFKGANMSIGAWIFEPRPSGVTDGAAWPTDPITHPTIEPRGTIIVLHGVADGPWWVRDKARAFARHGYRTVLVGLRGYAESTGSCRGFGVFERRDLMQLVDELDRQGLLAGHVGVWGVSYGGAIAIQFAGVDPRVRAVVSVGAFADMITAVPTALRATVPIGPWFSSDETLASVARGASEYGHFDICDASAERLIVDASAAILLIHGEWDMIVPFDHATRLCAASPGHACVRPLPATGHFGSFLDFGGRVQSASIAWFDQWLSPDVAIDACDPAPSEPNP